MILVTGGAGFIGSMLQARLAARGIETVICDRLGSDERWRNLARHPPARLVAPEDLDRFLASGPPLDAVVHLGAISETTARDADLTWNTNVALSEHLLDWCATREVPFLYASSAATYGDGSAGFDDDLVRLDALRPLNLYGWTKHVFDLRVAARRRAGRPMPPQCAGLKFFNVYGPNEYHKGSMISVVNRLSATIGAGDAARLFRSDRPGLADGAQSRDFIHVDDVVSVMLFLLDHRAVNGLFNVGTGIDRTYLDVARAVCHAHGVADRIDFVEMPETLRGIYQSYTRADIRRLRAVGYDADFVSIEDGIARYVRDHLLAPDPYV